MDIGTPRITSGQRPGAVSTFFVYKAGLFALCFWGWLAVAAWRGDAVTGWIVFAAAGATTTTIVGLLLAVRIVLARSAANRQDEVMRTLVEISWYAVARAPAPTAPDGDADVIPLPQEARPRPRR